MSLIKKIYIRKTYGYTVFFSAVPLTRKEKINYAVSDNEIFRNINIYAYSTRHYGPHSSSIKNDHLA